MARMHIRRRGVSGSTRPSIKEVPHWIRYKAKEVEKLALKLIRSNESMSLTGIKLRDSYGIPSVKAITGKKIGRILKENDLSMDIPEDLMNLIKRYNDIRKHLDKNKKDLMSKRSLQLTESKIRRLSKYYKRVKALPSDWKFDPSMIKLYIK